MNNKIRELLQKFYIQKQVVYFLVIMLFIIMEIFHSKIGLYFDDYGNASLSYGYDTQVIGMTWTFQDLLEWAKWIYMNFSGRILCGSLLNLLIKFGNGPRLFMSIQAGIVTALFYAMYKIIMRLVEKKHNIFVLIMIVALFFLTPLDMFRHNLCWASASVLYIWPLFPFFLTIYLQMKLDEDLDKKKNKKIYILLSMICIFFTAFSHEQTGLSIVVYLIGYVSYERIVKKQWTLRNIIYAIYSLVIYLCFFLAPGNWVRMNGVDDYAELGIFEKIATSYKPLMETLFNKNFCCIYILVTVCLVGLGFFLMKRERRRLLWYTAISSFLALGVVIISYCLQKTVGILVFGMIYLVLIFVSLVYYCILMRRYTMIVLLVATACSAFCVLVSPAIPLRCHTQWILVVDIVLVISAFDLWVQYLSKSVNLYKRISIIIYMCMYLFVCKNASDAIFVYYYGYSCNYVYYEKNASILENYNGESELILQKFPDDNCRSSMPYEANNSFIEMWIKQYYDIPYEAEFIWE